MNNFDEFLMIKHMLALAIESETNFGDYFKVIVEDAQIIRKNAGITCGYKIRRETYRYSTRLARCKESFVDELNPSRITKEQYKLLLDFFGSL